MTDELKGVIRSALSLIPSRDWQGWEDPAHARQIEALLSRMRESLIEVEETPAIWKLKDEALTELTDVRECPACGGHVKLDETYLLQVSATVSCPYCSTRLLFVEIGDEVLVFQNDEFGGEARLEFVGTVVGFKEDGRGGFYTQVQDQDDDVFDLEPHEFELEDE